MNTTKTRMGRDEETQREPGTHKQAFHFSF
jgi:hypothetical protein